jgi:hypothetical protein
MPKQTLASRLTSFGGTEIMAVLLGVTSTAITRWGSSNEMPPKQARWLALFTNTGHDDIPVSSDRNGELTRGQLLDKLDELRSAKTWMDTAIARVQTAIEQREAA